MKTLKRFRNWFILWRASRIIVWRKRRLPKSSTVITNDGRLSIEGREHVIVYGTNGINLKRKVDRTV